MCGDEAEVGLDDGGFFAMEAVGDLLLVVTGWVAAVTVWKVLDVNGGCSTMRLVEGSGRARIDEESEVLICWSLV